MSEYIAKAPIEPRDYRVVFLIQEKAAGGTLLLIRPVKESGFLKKGLHVFNLFLIQVFYVLDEVDSRRRQPDILRLV